MSKIKLHLTVEYATWFDVPPAIKDRPMAKIPIRKMIVDNVLVDIEKVENGGLDIYGRAEVKE